MLSRIIMSLCNKYLIRFELLKIEYWIDETVQVTEKVLKVYSCESLMHRLIKITDRTVDFVFLRLTSFSFTITLRHKSKGIRVVGVE